MRPSNFKSKITNPNFIREKKGGNNRKSISERIKQSRESGVLDLRNMSLDSLPKEVFDPNADVGIKWWEMCDINKFDASGNMLSEQCFDIFNPPSPPLNSFTSLGALIYLRLSNNKFKRIPNSIYSLANLKLLDMSNNEIYEINSEYIQNLKALVELDIQKNKLNSLPVSLQCLPFLEVLNASENNINNIPKGLNKIKKLYMHTNNIEYIYELLDMPLCEELYIYKNRISSIENGSNGSIFDNMKYLKYLDIHSNCLFSFFICYELPILDSILLSYNQINNIQGLNNCKNLTNLDLSNNKIKTFPNDILSLQKLNTLNLENNDLNEIPNQLGLMSSLIRLNVLGNPMRFLISKIKNFSTVNIKNFLKGRIYDNNKDAQNINNNKCLLDGIKGGDIVVKNAKVGNIPIEEIEKVGKNTSLKRLIFSNTSISSIDSLSNILHYMDNIIEIDFSNNFISMFPIYILSLPFISIINMRKNKLKSFPFEKITTNNLEYVKCVNLTYIDLSLNLLENIPEILGLFTKLDQINLSSNHISSIEILKNMRLFSLSVLNLSDNKIEYIPYKIYKNIPNLKTFQISNNNLKEIPTDICLLKHLNSVQFYGNQIRRIRNELLGNSSGLINYLRKLHQFDEEDYNFDNMKSNNVKSN